MDPMDLIALYQSGEWDGEELIWSNDTSTYVSVQWRSEGSAEYHRNGCLRYYFHNYLPTNLDDGSGRFITEGPWWIYTDEYDYEPEFLAYDVTDDGIVTRDEVVVPLYVDLPNGMLSNDTELGEVLEIVPCEMKNGVMVYTTSGIWVFQRGELVAGWPGLSAEDLANFHF